MNSFNSWRTKFVNLCRPYFSLFLFLSLKLKITFRVHSRPFWSKKLWSHMLNMESVCSLAFLRCSFLTQGSFFLPDFLMKNWCKLNIFPTWKHTICKQNPSEDYGDHTSLYPSAISSWSPIKHMISLDSKPFLSFFFLLLSFTLLILISLLFFLFQDILRIMMIHLFPYAFLPSIYIGTYLHHDDYEMDIFKESEWMKKE